MVRKIIIVKAQTIFCFTLKESSELISRWRSEDDVPESVRPIKKKYTPAREYEYRQSNLKGIYPQAQLTLHFLSGNAGLKKFNS
jgi:hypothetical protein